MKNLSFLIVMFLLFSNALFAQVSINADNSTPDVSAGLDVKFPDKGFLPPRLTTIQRDAIQNPAEGLTIYNSDLHCLEFYAGATNGWHCPCLSFGTINCSSQTVNGTYMEGVPLIASNTLSLTINNTTTGGYNISTNTVNGFRFSKIGTFTSIGIQSIVLNGIGTPTAAGTVNFIVTYGNSNCTFQVTAVVPINMPCPGTPTVTYSGQVYNTVQIGNQCWFKENLNIGTRIAGSSEQNNHNAIEKYCYYNSDAYCTTYGGLYQWDNMMQWSTTAGVQGICPAGWHIPTNDELNTLSAYLGGAVAGGKMKTTGTIEAGSGLWFAPNAGATNESGFSAIPGGYRNYDATFNTMGSQGVWWSSNEISTTRAWGWAISSDFTFFAHDNDNKPHGFSVRCLKN
ncbi:MAG: hypothetical protein NT040_16105 [Bacteroidetes bacterium]|nr:hypothetical protein [Bacteroidota bacterium]